MSELLGTVRQEIWQETPDHVFRLDLTEERMAELRSLWNHAVSFDTVCRINYGAQISSAESGAFGRDRYLAGSAEGMTNPKRFYEGSNMRPFGMTWDGVWLDLRPDEMYGPRRPALFENAKVSIRHISGDADTFVAWVDEEHFYTDHGVIHAVPYHLVAEEPSYRVQPEQIAGSERYPIFYLLGIVMSHPVLSYYAELFATGSLQGAFSHVYPNKLKELPIPQLDERPGEPPENWWDQIVSLGSGRVTTAALRRAFRERLESASVLAAVAERRQEVEQRRAQRLRDFSDFMLTRNTSWRWQQRESLEEPPDEDDFLQRLGDELTSIEAVTSVRDAFREQTTAARADLQEAALLKEAIDALANRLFAG